MFSHSSVFIQLSNSLVAGKTKLVINGQIIFAIWAFF